MGFQVSGDAATTRTNLGLGDAATKTVGTGAGNVPLNSDLGDAATKTVGTATGNIPLVDNLKTVGGTSIVGTGDIDVGGGKVLQVVQGTYSTQTTINTGNTLTKTGLLVDITPTAASSKILVLVNFSVNRSVAGGSVNRFDLRKDDTSIHIFGGIHQDGATTVFQTASGMYLDSPATTSATEYSLYVCGSTSYFFNYSSTIIAMEIGA